MAARMKIFSRVVIGVVAAVVVVMLLADDWFRWFLLGTIGGALGIFALQHLGSRQAEAAAPPGPLHGRPSEGPRQPHPLYNPNKVRPYGPAGAYITSHPVGLVIALGIAFLAVVKVPLAALFLLGALAAGGVVGVVLWLRNR